jgi:hypothetical protein
MEHKICGFICSPDIREGGGDNSVRYQNVAIFVVCYEHFTSGIISYVSIRSTIFYVGKELGSADNDGITYITILV